MRKLTVLLIFTVFFISCDKKDKVEKAIEEVPVELDVERFDKVFYETPPEDLSKIKRQYPYFFPAGNEDTVWTNKMKNPLLRELHAEVQKTFGNFQKERGDLEELFRHIKYYFPETNLPKVITLISEVDTQSKVIYADSLLLISLDVYLGKDHKFYSGFPEYQRRTFEKSQILPDVVSDFSLRKIAPPTDRALLSQMIYFGKELYLKDVLIPQVSDADKIGYTPEQITWSQENEGYIWRYFVDEKLLYDSDPKLPGRFINPAPFSKFYLEIDNESPGQIGMWIGWQIVRSYMKNNDVSLQQLLQADAKEIFDNSKYKPKK
ncbi:gliding motility-associated lipoprotein GldB [Flavobacterium endophyticum]|uniref:Gliding motility-associated lipoprotein GldB n=1 Tax=Flavobacterium endophyticum TaxID=1540163 RepID=A0A495MKC9_9FLAO|nr:gliding motility lipoprotein GldB [Flavobacterium endophyticum]RKS25830.1 gliding motility-associated lipoprotein GldB [Flavobacterium endophyticum]